MDYILERKMPKLTKKAVTLIGNDQSKFNNIDKTSPFNSYSASYVFTTENINAYYDRLDLNGKSILTVAGSGDHILNAILRGARKIDAFDISGYAILFYYLKEAAVKSFNYEEFIEFFLSKNALSYDAYLKLRPNLNPEVVNYYDTIFSKKSTGLLESPLFREVPPSFIQEPIKKASIISGVSSYLEPENYTKLQEKMDNCQVSLFLRDIKEIGIFADKYDYIFLSNIIEYVGFDKLGEYKKLMEEYISKLNIMGEIKIGYLYLANHSLNLKKYVDIFNGDYTYENVPSAYQTVMTPGYVVNDDLIIGYKKKA